MASQLGILARLFRLEKLVGAGAKVGGAAGKAASGTSRALKLGALGGLGSFFGFEWLTSGGLVDSTAGALGISNSAASVLVVGVVLVGLGLVVYAVYKHIVKPAPKPRTPRGGK